MNADELQDLVARVYYAGTVEGLPNLRSALASFDPTGGAERAAAAGGACLVAFKLGQDPSDLMAAVELLAQAQRQEPTASRASNLAAALWEQNDLIQDAQVRATNHDRAKRLMRWALAQTDPTSSSWVTRATTLVDGLLEAVVEDWDGANLDEVLRLADLLIDRAEQVDGRLAAEAHNQLGSVLLVAADRGHRDGDLDRAIESLRRSVELTPEEHLDLPARRSNLASALNDRYERGGGIVNLEESAREQQRALDAFHPDDSRRSRALNNLANAYLGVWRHFHRRSDLEKMGRLLPELMRAFQPGESLYETAFSNAGLIADEVAAAGDSAEMADLAVTLHRRAVETTPPAHPYAPGRRSSLAVSLMRRYDRSGRPEDLTEALAEGEAVLDLPPGATHEQAIFQATLAHSYHERFLAKGRISDLEAAAALHRNALNGLSRTSPFAPALLNNAATVLSDRFDRLGELPDLERAIGALQESLQLSGDQPHPERAARLNNLAIMNQRWFGFTGDAADLAEAIQMAQRGYDEAHALVSPVLVGAAAATLSDLLATAVRDLNDTEAQRRLQELWQQLAEEGLTTRPVSAGTWLYRRAVVGGLIGTSTSRRQDLRAAFEAALPRRPSVALAAARQLVFDALSDQIQRDGPARAVEAAADLARTALAAVQDIDDPLRHALSWQRDIAGVAAALAQSRVLVGDASGAFAAYEAGHAVLLQGRAADLPTGPPGVARPTPTRPQPGEPALDGAIVTTWCTPHGGGAVRTGPDGAQVAVVLPNLTSGTVEGWTRRLGKASRLSGAALERTLELVTRQAESLLVQPVAAAVAPGTPLLWCAGGVLAAVPISGAKAADGQPMLDRHPLQHAPTHGVAGWAGRVAQRRDIGGGPWLSLGAPAPSTYPVLPAAAAEMAAFALEQERYAGAAATVAAAIAGIERGAVVHFATHARTTAADPLMNHLLLAGDQRLFADDVAGLVAPGRLAVLSACDTANPGDAHADEGLGLTGAFLAAGFPAVVSSLWSVADRHTAGLMRTFADRLREGAEPATALRSAAMVSREAAAPAGVWAAFVLNGA